MNWLKKLFEGPHCKTCGVTLDTQRYARGAYALDDLANSYIRAAYKCRSCGSLVCITCAETIPCRKCGGQVFDVALK